MQTLRQLTVFDEHNLVRAACLFAPDALHRLVELLWVVFAIDGHQDGDVLGGARVRGCGGARDVLGGGQSVADAIADAAEDAAKVLQPRTDKERIEEKLQRVSPGAVPLPELRHIRPTQQDEEVAVLIVEPEGGRLLHGQLCGHPLHVIERQFVHHIGVEAVIVFGTPAPLVVYGIDEERFFEESYLVDDAEADEAERRDDAVHLVDVIDGGVRSVLGGARVRGCGGAKDVCGDGEAGNDVARLVVVGTACLAVDGLRSDGSHAVSLLLQCLAHRHELLYEMLCADAVLVAEEHIAETFRLVVAYALVLREGDARVVHQGYVGNLLASVEMLGKRGVRVVDKTHLVYLWQQLQQRLLHSRKVRVV